MRRRGRHGFGQLLRGAGVLALTAALTPARADDASVRRHAVLVGVNEGGGSLEPLQYAEMDAERMSAVLVELAGMDPADVTVLYAPTAVELKDALHAHADVAEGSSQDMFVFYYSGHADARGLRLGAEVYPFDTLKADIRAMPAEVKLGVLDACRSGTITRLKGASLTTPFLVEEQLSAEGEAWMTATSADESAQESDRLRGSFFTHYLISGLRGAADTGDGEVSLDEAYRYASDRVVDSTGGTTGGVQHPNFDYRLKGQGELTLTRVAQGHSTVTFPPELSGQVTVLKMPDRTPVAEVAKVAGRPSVLALAPGSYLLRLRPTTGLETREALVGLADGGRVTVTRWGDVNLERGGTKGPGFGQDALELARRTAEASKPWLADAVNAHDLRHSALAAGSLSVLLPGAGQFYNKQWLKGGLYLATAATFFSGSLVAVDPDNQFFHGSITGPDFLRLSAAMVYGASIADASYNAERREERRPYTGWTLSSSAAWIPEQPTSPWVAGMNAEWVPNKHFSIAIDRAGWTSAAPGTGAWGIGGKGSVFFLQGDRLRPSFFVASGMRYRYDQLNAGFLSGSVGWGLGMRWYVTPRYFVEHELRWETEGGEGQVALGGGLGVHFGKATSRRTLETRPVEME